MKNNTLKPDFNYTQSLKNKTGNFIIKKVKFIDLYINRPIAGLMVKAVFNTRITPNGLTYFAFFLGLLSPLFYIQGNYHSFIIGGALAQLSSIIDGADGMLARSKNICTEFGSHLDLLFDRVNDFLLFSGIAYGASLYYQNHKFLLLGLLAAGLYLLQINLFYLTKSFLNNHNQGETGEARAFMIFLIMIFSFINRLDMIVYLILVETILVNLIRLIHFISLGYKKKI